MRTTGTILMNAYAALLLAVLVLGPLVLMHGYRTWWVVVFYAAVGVGAIGGIVSHYSAGVRKRKS